MIKYNKGILIKGILAIRNRKQEYWLSERGMGTGNWKADRKQKRGRKQEIKQKMGKGARNQMGDRKKEGDGKQEKERERGKGTGNEMVG